MDWKDAEEMTGTTIIAAEFDGGVVIAADSRSSSGSYVANRASMKIQPVSKYVFCCRSGSSADTEAVRDAVAYQMNILEMELGEPAMVKTVANNFRQFCYNYRDSLSCGFICAGWDKRHGGQVFAIPIGGMVTRQPITAGGSGSTYIYGFIDGNYKPGMDKESCVKFLLEAVTLAMKRDGSSGGCIRIGIITEKGVEIHTITEDQFPKFHTN